MLRWRYLKMTFWFWFGLIWAGVGTAFVIFSIVFFLDARRDETASVEVSGTVVEKGHDTDKNGNSHYWMRYVFHDDAGTEHVERARVGWENWRRYSDGDPIAVAYVRGSPDRSRMVEIESNDAWVLIPAFAAGGLLFGGIGWVLVIRSFIRSGERARLIQQGIGSLGTVTAVEVNTNVRINGRHPVFLRYAFTDDAGGTHEGRSLDLPRHVQRRWSVGDEILVAHDPIDPTRHDADVFEIRADELEMLKRR